MSVFMTLPQGFGITMSQFGSPKNAERFSIGILSCNGSFRDLQLFPFDSAMGTVIRGYGADSLNRR